MKAANWLLIFLGLLLMPLSFCLYKVLTHTGGGVSGWWYYGCVPICAVIGLTLGLTKTDIWFKCVKKED